jgi:hypothetical protein
MIQTVVTRIVPLVVFGRWIAGAGATDEKADAARTTVLAIEDCAATRIFTARNCGKPMRSKIVDLLDWLTARTLLVIAFSIERIQRAFYLRANDDVSAKKLSHEDGKTTSLLTNIGHTDRTRDRHR